MAESSEPNNSDWVRPGQGGAQEPPFGISSRKETAFQTRRFGHGPIPKILAGLFLVSGLGVGIWLYLQQSKQFPLLSPGSYVGSLVGVLEPGRAVSFYIERAPDTDELFVAVLAPGWRPQIRSTTLVSFSVDNILGRESAAGDRESGDSVKEVASSQRWSLPLLVSSGPVQIELSGSAQEGGVFSGIARNIAEGAEGVWSLQAIRSPPGDIQSEASEIRRWLMLKTEMQEVEERGMWMEGRIPEQRAEIDKLTALLTEGQELRTRANERFVVLRQELLEANKALEQERKEVRRLEQALDVSQKVTPAGRLVGLSRESLEREERILEAIFEELGGGGIAGIDEQYQRAEEALALQRQLNEYRRELFGDGSSVEGELE